MNNELNLSKLIAKTAIVAFSIIVMAFFSFVGVFTFLNPAFLGKMIKSLQLNKATIYYYELSYKKSQDVNDLYVLLNEVTKQSNTRKTISYFEEFMNNSQYNEFIDYINNYYMEKTQDNLLKTYVANEDARLKTKYIEALLKENETDKAFLFMIKDLEEEVFVSVNDYANLNFIASSYVKHLLVKNAPLQDYEKFTNYTDENTTINFLQEALSYYNNIKQIYDVSFYLRSENENSFKLYMIANHLFEVANTIRAVDNKLNSDVNTEQLLNDITDYITHLETLRSELTQLN